MFTLTNLWQVINYLKDPDAASTVDSNLKVTALSDKTEVEKWFTSALDQPVFATDDYKRLRSFIIDWYTALRSFVTTQRNASNVWSLPLEHVYELFRSFGYNYPENVIGIKTADAFFLDLVNLYKIKGTPEALVSVMEFHNVVNADIIEYYVERVGPSDYWFVGKSTLRGQSPREDIPDKIVTFNEMTSNDPHWMQTEADLEALFGSNEISFPSSSPYISIRSRMSVQRFDITVGVIRRMAEDQYYLWDGGGSLPLTIRLSLLDKYVSLLELYAVIVYTYSRILREN